MNEETEKIPFAAEVWEQLSSIDCSEHVKEKGEFSYLSWVWAWGILMENYPESHYGITAPIYYDNGTAEIQITVVVVAGEESLSRTMWLPVMDFRNTSVEHPSSRHISDTRMRCLVKCIAMFGLGHYIYAGEDIPREEDAQPIHRFKPGEKEEIIVQSLKCLERDDKEGLQEILDEYGDDPSIKTKVWFLFDSGQRSSMKKLLNGE